MRPFFWRFRTSRFCLSCFISFSADRITFAILCCSRSEGTLTSIPRNASLGAFRRRRFVPSPWWPSIRRTVFGVGSFHEVAHVLLGASTLHSRSPFESDDEIEQWCNRAAAALFIPKDDLLTLDLVQDRGDYALWTEEEIEELANRYGVSPAAMIRRLDTFDRIADPPFHLFGSSLTVVGVGVRRMGVGAALAISTTRNSRSSVRYSPVLHSEAFTQTRLALVTCLTLWGRRCRTSGRSSKK